MSGSEGDYRQGTVFVKTCTFCGSQVRIPEIGQWVYKRMTRTGKRLYFCSYGCLRQFDKGAPINRWAIPIQEEA